MKSIMHDKDSRTCYLCMLLHSDFTEKAVLEEHHVIYGSGRRKLSEKYGLKVYLCPAHHRHSPESIHDNTAGMKDHNQKIKELAQKAFEETFPNLDFIEVFGKNYKRSKEESHKKAAESCQKAAGTQELPEGFIWLEEQ